MPLLSFLQHSEACSVTHLEVGHGGLLSDDFLEGRVYILLIRVLSVPFRAPGIMHMLKECHDG